jgi:hypothetical protein
MKSHFPTIFRVALAALLLTASAQGAELMGHWTFSRADGDAVEDLSGNGRNALLAFAGVRDLDGAGALVLDGHVGHGRIAGSGSMTFPNGVTMTAWIHPKRLARNNVVFGKPNLNPAWTTPTVGIFAPEDGVIGFGLWVQPKTIVAAPRPTPTDTWTFVAATYDNQVARLYVNGELVAQQRAGKPIPASSDPLFVGTGTTGNRFYRGMIGEIRLYDGPIAAADVEKLYRDGMRRYPYEPQPDDAGRTVVVRSKRNPKGEWREYPTRTLERLDGYAKGQTPVELSKYGGWNAKRARATGFFRAEKIGDRWWLIDPEGCYFLHVGVGTVRPGSSPNARKNLARKFGDRETWAVETAGLLRELHFNGTGGWTDNEQLRRLKAPFPYIVRLALMSGFGRKLGVTHQVPGHTGFELQSIPVFHPDFPRFCEEEVKQLAAYRDDPYVVGIYSDNELQTPILENYLKLDRDNPAQRPNYEAALRWLQQRKGKPDVSADDVTVLDRLEFAGYAFERYFRIASEAIKRAAPNHLYIGSRFMRPNFTNPFIWKAAEPYCDVVTVNYYGTWGPDLDEVAYWQSLCRRPIMITEFYVKGDDSGLPNNTGAGWIVPTQADRGRFYQHYVLGLLESGACVGWHWFKYLDNDPADTKAEPSNIDSNKGIVDLEYEPYTEFTDLMREVNAEVYPLTEYFDARR